MKKILFFYAFIFIFSISHYSICSEKYKLFGITRAQYKKALVFTPLHKEPPSYFDFRMSLHEGSGLAF